MKIQYLNKSRVRYRECLFMSFYLWIADDKGKNNLSIQL